MTHPHRAPELRPPCAPATLARPTRAGRARSGTDGVGRRHPDEFLVTIRIKKHELGECLRRTPQHGTIHDSLYNAFSFGLFAAYELESEDRELLQKLIGEWRSQYRRPNDARPIGKSDEELIAEYYGTKEPDVIQQRQ